MRDKNMFERLSFAWEYILDTRIGHIGMEYMLTCPKVMCLLVIIMLLYGKLLVRLVLLNITLPDINWLYKKFVRQHFRHSYEFSSLLSVVCLPFVPAYCKILNIALLNISSPYPINQFPF